MYNGTQYVKQELCLLSECFIFPSFAIALSSLPPRRLTSSILGISHPGPVASSSLTLFNLLSLLIPMRLFISHWSLGVVLERVIIVSADRDRVL